MLCTVFPCLVFACIFWLEYMIWMLMHNNSNIKMTDCCRYDQILICCWYDQKMICCWYIRPNNNMYYNRNSKGYKCGNLLGAVCLVLPKIDLILSNWHGDLFVWQEWQPFPKRWYNEGIVITNSVVKVHVCHSSAFQTISVRSVYIKIIKDN